MTDLDRLREIERFVDDPEFRASWQQIKKDNKKRLAKYIGRLCGTEVKPDTMFDVQVKRIHEYKRQLLNALHVIYLYHRLIRHPEQSLAPRTVLFAGKAAPTYWKAKLIIKLITSIADIVNNDPRISGRLKVVFLPNYTVSQAEMVIPAADLSEQISTAGTEASGTGNMKFALNGALTIGTLDGANIEILEEVGRENIFIFGMTAEEAEYERLNVSKTPWEICQGNPDIMHVVEAIRDGAFSHGNAGLFQPLVDSSARPARPLSAHCRSAVVYRLSAAGQYRLSRSGCLDQDGHFECGADGEIFHGQDYQAVCKGNLGGSGGIENGKRSISVECAFFYVRQTYLCVRRGGICAIQAVLFDGFVKSLPADGLMS